MTGVRRADVVNQTVVGNSSAKPSGLLRLGGYLFLFVWIITLVDGAWGYLFRRFLHKSPPSITALLLGVGFCFLFRLLGRRVQLPFPDSRLAWGAWVMATYLLLCGIIQSNIQSTSVILLFFGFYISFFYLFAFAVSPLVAGALSPNSARIFLLLFSVVMSGIGVAQAVTKNLFAFGYYITSSVDSINATTSGKVRASAFFNHSDDLGVFLCIPLAIAVTSFFRAYSRGRKLIFLSCILIIVAGCAATLTRIVYLSAAITLFLTIWGELRRRDSRIFAQGHIFPMWLPLLLMVVGLSLFFVRYLVEAVLMNVSFLHDYRYLVSSKSLDERLYGIYYYLKHIDSFGMTGWIFGLGWIFRSNMKALVPIDNGFVGVLLNVGVLGAVIWAWLSFRCWQILNKMAARSNNELALPFTAFYALWLLLQVFGAYLQPFMVAVLCVATLTPEWIRRFGIESSRG